MTQENEIKRPTQDLEHEPISSWIIARKAAKLARRWKPSPYCRESPTPTGYCAPDSRNRAFNDRLGNQFGAAITYFSFL